jgi:apolipoprotein D and lipocalin family protein
MKKRSFLRSGKRGRRSRLGTAGLVAAGVAAGLGLAWLFRRSRRKGSHRHLAPLHTVPFVDLPRYMGTWYEIASFPQRFQKGCVGTTASYTIRGPGKVEVVNRCRKGSLTGPSRSVRGVARVVDTTTNAKLKVRFFWPFEGDYWIIELADDYSWAAVATPDRESLWVLSRTPNMSDETFAGIVTRLVKQGFEIGKLNRTVQSEMDASPMRGF